LLRDGDSVGQNSRCKRISLDRTDYYGESWANVKVVQGHRKTNHMGR